MDCFDGCCFVQQLFYYCNFCATVFCRSKQQQSKDAEDHEHDADAKHSRDAFKSISASFAGSMFEALHLPRGAVVGYCR